jgi:glycerol kinase
VTVLALDQGTSGTKAMVHDGETVQAVVELPVTVTYLDGGGVEVDPHLLLETLLEAGRRAVREAGDPPLSAVALANQGETVLAWDPITGQPLSAAIVWQDRRAEGICQELRPRAELIAARTGLVLDPYFSAPKMTWVRRHVTEHGIVTTTDAWLVHQLTGELVTDVSTASRSLLLDIDRVCWDQELLEIFGLEAEILPRLVANDEVVGSTTAFGSNIPVGGLIVDQQAALAAQGCLEAGTAKCTIGTGAFVLGNTGRRPVRSRSGLTTSVAWSVAGATAYCLDGQAYTAGSAIAWLVSTGLLSNAESLDAECADTTGGAVFVPGLAGLAAPWWSAAPCGAILGLTLATQGGQIVRAVVEGLACQIAALVAELDHDSGSSVERLPVDGGLTRSAVLMQALADLLQRPVDCYASPHATALGAAAMGRLSVETDVSLSEAVGRNQPAVSFEPTWSRDKADEAMSSWRSAVAAVLVREGNG